ncbi:hypothetical protein TrST_g11232 [Triparma strigata]|uniref:Uncharacterized protein n=1 Tax=Triparma strigata TaxID=1606541 RepID=A0A9W7BCL7_9STRA|nr:hypothetical protein TrST_g11232 [Triparma strigata]
MAPPPGPPPPLPPPPGSSISPRARANTVDVKAETGKISSAFEKTFYKFFKEFCSIRLKARKTPDDKARLKELFTTLKTEATKATDQLQPTIQKCMEFYRTAGGPGYFQLDPEFIVPMLLKRKQLCDEDITDPSEKAEYLIGLGEDTQEKFQAPLKRLVADFNDPNASFERMYKRYLFKMPPPSIKNLPWRNPTFVLEPGNSNRVVRERFGPLKDEKRGRAKIKQGSELTDINRVTLEFEDPKILEFAFRCIVASNFVIVCVKNKLNETNQPPCIHLNVAVMSGQSGYEHDWICEIQLYLRSILRIKTTSHIFYNVARAENEFAIKDVQDKNEVIVPIQRPKMTDLAMLSNSFRELQDRPQGAPQAPVRGGPKFNTSVPVPPSEETKVIETALVEAKKKKDLPLMKSLKAKLALSKQTDSAIAATSAKAEDLQQQVEEAWDGDDDDLIERLQGLLEEAEAEKAAAEKPRLEERRRKEEEERRRKEEERRRKEVERRRKEEVVRKFGKRTDSDIKAAAKEWCTNTVKNWNLSGKNTGNMFK